MRYMSETKKKKKKNYRSQMHRGRWPYIPSPLVCVRCAPPPPRVCRVPRLYFLLVVIYIIYPTNLSRRGPNTCVAANNLLHPETSCLRSARSSDVKKICNRRRRQEDFRDLQDIRQPTLRCQDSRQEGCLLHFQVSLCH